MQVAVETSATEKAKTAIKAEMNTLVTTEIEKAFGTKTADAFKKMLNENEEIKGLKEWKIKAETDMRANQTWIDDQIAKGKTINFSAGNIAEAQIELAKALEENKDKLAQFKNTKKGLSFELTNPNYHKAIAAGDFTVSGTQGFINPAMFFEPGRKPYEQTHIRNIFRVVPQGPATNVYVVRDSGPSGTGPTQVNVATAKPESGRAWVKTIVPITKVAHWYKVPEEYLDDIIWLRDEITGVGVEELLAKEDELILTGVAAGEQFAGMNQTFNSTAFSAATAGMANSILKTTNYDVLVAAWTQLRILKSVGDFILMHPADYGKLILTKDTNGNYILGAPNATLPSLYNMPIIPHTAVTSDKYFLGASNRGKIGQRAGLTVRFYDQNEDDAKTNMVLIVIEERITFAMDRADRIIYGDFSDNASAISASY